MKKLYALFIAAIALCAVSVIDSADAGRRGGPGGFHGGGFKGPKFGQGLKRFNSHRFGNFGGNRFNGLGHGRKFANFGGPGKKFGNLHFGGWKFKGHQFGKGGFGNGHGWKNKWANGHRPGGGKWWRNNRFKGGWAHGGHGGGHKWWKHHGNRGWANGHGRGKWWKHHAGGHGGGKWWKHRGHGGWAGGHGGNGGNAMASATSSSSSSSNASAIAIAVGLAAFSQINSSGGYHSGECVTCGAPESEPFCEVTDGKGRKLKGPCDQVNQLAQTIRGSVGKTGDLKGGSEAVQKSQQNPPVKHECHATEDEDCVHTD